MDGIVNEDKPGRRKFGEIATGAAPKKQILARVGKIYS
jgi:hypothetical protein